MKTYSSRSYVVAEAIARHESFKTHGALKATDGRYLGPNDSGQLNRIESAEWLTDITQDGLAYVVWSYSTPIAWVTKSGKVHKVAQKFSVTTSKHQGKLYLLNGEAK